MYSQLDLLGVYYMVNMVEPSSICDGRCLPSFVHPKLRHITHELCECQSPITPEAALLLACVRYSPSVQVSWFAHVRGSYPPQSSSYVPRTIK